MDVSVDLARINASLAAEGIRMRLEQRGRKLNLRGPLPCRQTPHATRTQRLSLGLPADAQGLREAERTLQLVDLQLRRQQFRWDQWATDANGIASSNAAATPGLEHQLEQFEQAFFQDPRRRRSAAGSRSTWTAAYRPYLRRLRSLASEHNLPLGTELKRLTLESM
jgi:hypothetical protein